MVNFKTKRTKTYVTEKEDNKLATPKNLPMMLIDNESFLLLYQAALKCFSSQIATIFGFKTRFVGFVKENWFSVLNYLNTNQIDLSQLISSTDVQLFKRMITNINQGKKKTKESLNRFDYSILFNKAPAHSNKPAFLLNFDEKDFFLKSKKPVLSISKRKKVIKKLEKRRKNSVRNKLFGKKNCLIILENISQLSGESFKHEFFNFIKNEQVLEHLNSEYLVKFFCKNLSKIERGENGCFNSFLIEAVSVITGTSTSVLKNLILIARSLFLILFFTKHYVQYKYKENLKIDGLKSLVERKRLFSNESANKLISEGLKNFDSLLYHKTKFKSSGLGFKLDLDFIITIIIFSSLQYGSPLTVSDFYSVFKNKVYIGKRKLLLFDKQKDTRLTDILDYLPNSAKIHKYNELFLSMNDGMRNFITTKQNDLILTFLIKFIEELNIGKEIGRSLIKYVEDLDLTRFQALMSEKDSKAIGLDNILYTLSMLLTFFLHNTKHILYTKTKTNIANSIEAERLLYNKLITHLNNSSFKTKSTVKNISTKIKIKSFDIDDAKAISLIDLNSFLKTKQKGRVRRNSFVKTETVTFSDCLVGSDFIRNYIDFFMQQDLNTIHTTYGPFNLLYKFLTQYYQLQQAHNQYFKMYKIFLTTTALPYLNKII